MNKFKLYIKPIIFLTLGFALMFIFRDKYKEFFFPKKEVKDFIVEFTNDFKSEDDDLLINAGESIDSYLLIKINKDINNFEIIDGEKEIASFSKIESPKTIALMINHNNYNGIVKFEMNDKKYIISTEKLDNYIKINVDEKDKKE